MRRLSLAIHAWTEVLLGTSGEPGGVDTSMDTTPTTAAHHVKLGGTPELEVGSSWSVQACTCVYVIVEYFGRWTLVRAYNC